MHIGDDACFTNAARKVKAVTNKAKIDKNEDTSRNVRLSTSLNIVNFRLNLSNLRTYKNNDDEGKIDKVN